MQNVRIGQIGLGAFGREHLSTWLSLPGVEVAAVCSLDRTELDEARQRDGVTGCYTDYRDVIEKAHVDAVDVVTPENQHLDPALAAIAAGKHLFVEKPIATTLADADRIIAAAAASRVVAMVGHVLRFDTRYAQVKDLIDAGHLGHVASIYARRNNGRSLYDRYKRVFPPLVNILHDIDLALWFVGQPVEQVYCAAHHALSTSTEWPDVYWLFVQFAGGTLAAFESSWLIPPGAPTWLDARMEVVGTAGTALVECAEQGLTIWKEGQSHWPDTMHWPIVRGMHRI